MRNTSAAYKQQFNKERKYCVKVIINYTDGTQDILTDLQDFMKIKIEDSCSGTSSFQLGAAIINEAVIVLNNRSGKFDGKSFYGAELTVFAGIYVDGLPELLKMGVYIVDEPVAPGVSISLTAYDRLIWTDSTYDALIPYPATLGQIAADVCDQCGITLKTIIFPNSDYVVQKVPEKGCTCRDMLSYVAQIAGCFVRCNSDGQVEFRWYSGEKNYTVQGVRSKSIGTDEVTVTGIKVHTDDEDVSAGSEGYQLAIDNNVLVEEGKAQTVANYLSERLVGMRFRPLSVTCRSDASIEAGDRIEVIDEKGKTYETVVTSTTYTVMDNQKITCDAESPAANSSRRLSDQARAVIRSRQYTQQKIEEEKTEREKSSEEFEKLLDTSSGMYMTDVVQEDGSTIRYMHDKKKLSDSELIWKITANAVGISTDGGKSYPYGMDVSGAAVLERIYAVGLNADYITSGTIVAKDKNGNVVFSVNVETGDVSINAEAIKMKTGSLKDYADANDKRVSEIEAEAGQVSVTATDEQGTLSSVINTKTWETKYVDANGNELSAIRFDPLKQRFEINGGLAIDNNLYTFGKVINVENMWAKSLLLWGVENSNASYATFDSDKLVVYSEGNHGDAAIGLTSGSLPMLQLGALRALHFDNGAWIGIGANGKESTFYPNNDCYGIFIDTEKKSVYVVNGLDSQEIYTGSAIARFG